ncbi:uncharacterized protein [Solanum lycopersicum]|uniref:uncharacterized protein n=1 Tax=Solanum lycopersicum TaxID=4081 RepID=UPI000532B27E
METTAGTGAEMIIDSPPVVSIPQKKGDRILDSYRNSLSQKTVDILIFTQQWIRSPSKEWKVQNYLEEVQKIEEVEKEYPGAPLSIDYFKELAFCAILLIYRMYV